MHVSAIELVEDRFTVVEVHASPLGLDLLDLGSAVVPYRGERGFAQFLLERGEMIFELLRRGGDRVNDSKGGSTDGSLNPAVDFGLLHIVQYLVHGDLHIVQVAKVHLVMDYGGCFPED